MKNLKKFFTMAIVIATTTLSGCASDILGNGNANSVAENELILGNYLEFVGSKAQKGAPAARQVRNTCRGNLTIDTLQSLSKIGLSNCLVQLGNYPQKLADAKVKLTTEQENVVSLYLFNKEQIASWMKEEAAEKAEAAKKARGEEEKGFFDRLGDSFSELGSEIGEGFSSLTSNEEKKATK